MNLAELTREVKHRMQPTGGRPKVVGTSIYRNIPVTEVDDAVLKAISMTLSEQGVMATPAQVAAVILQLAIEEYDRSEKKVGKTTFSGFLDGPFS
jgi:hypothetical protein